MLPTGEYDLVLIDDGKRLELKTNRVTVTRNGKAIAEVIRRPPPPPSQVTKKDDDKPKPAPQKEKEKTREPVKDKEKSKEIQKKIKDLKLKVNATIQGETLRVTGSKRDDLQAVIAHLKANPPEIPLQFNNFR